MSTTIADAAQALAGLLRAAEDGGLPAPYDASINRFAPYGHPAYEDDRISDGGISLALHALVDLTAWALWLDEPITDRVVGDNVHHSANGYAGPFPVRAYAIDTNALAEVSA